VADSNGTAPDIYKIIWDFGDQTANLTVDNSGNVKHIFAAKGTYSINAKMLDQSNNQIASASATAIISADPTNFDIWLNITGVRFELYIPDVLYSNGDNPIGSRFIRDTTTTWGIPFNTKDGPVVNGTTFIFTGKGAWDLSESVTQADSTTTITASVNQDASVLLSFKYEAVKTILYSQGDITSEVYKEVFELQNVPIHLTTVSRLSYEPPYLADVSPYVKNVMVENKTTYINDTTSIRSITSLNFKGAGSLDISFTYK
jgi:PKD repeat protein